jgi:hypothetical protein
MYIQPNKMLSPISRVLKPYMCSMIATEGPNILGKLNLSGLEIAYDSQYVTRITLNPGATDQPLMYGFLGNNVTFLMLKVTYDENDPKCIIEENQYIEYWFKDNPTNIRYIGKMFVLTGNSVKRIPQIFLSNPGTVKVYIDVMMANLEQSNLILDDINNDIMKIYNLYYNSIISDTFWNTTSSISGSTQLQILDIDNNIVLYLDYTEIDTIEQDITNYELIINTKSMTVIHLGFLSLFDMYQGNSRINWVTKKNTIRFLSKEIPTLDLVPPTITINVGVIPIILPNIYVFPVTPDPITSGFTIQLDDILNYFINNITDDRDGEISITDATIKVRQESYIEQLTGITETGIYDIVITIADIANNTTYANYIIIVDFIPPIITFNQGIGTGFTMTIPNDTRIPASGITRDDIIRKTIYNIVDNVDGIIANSAVTIQISGISLLTSVTEPGEYIVTFNASDKAGNTSTYIKYMFVTGYIVINSGDTFTLSDIMNSASFIYGGDSGTTAIMIISGNSYLIANYGGNFVWDYSGINQHIFTYSGETLNVTINNTVFNFTFIEWGSLYFNILNMGTAPYINLNFINEYRLDSQTGYTDSGITNINTDYLIYLDNDSNSIFNIKTINVTSNYGNIQNTPIFLESFELNDLSSGITSGTTSGTSLYEYYITKYPSFNISTLDNILLGNLPMIYIFEHNGNIEIDDTISIDVINSIVLYGDYPTGTYRFVLTLINEYGFTNIIRFNFIIN